MKFARSITAFLCGITTWGALAAENPKPRQFVFAPAVATSNATVVAPEMNYIKERGFGFEPGAKLRAAGGGVASDAPFFFSVAVPEGNWRVTVTLSDVTGESGTTVKAELRRLMLEQVRTAKGEAATRSFTVNVRTTKFPGGEVRLKEREKTSEAWAWDEKLTLEFNGSHPCIRALDIVAAPAAPTVFLLGDSTVCDQPREPYASWGQMLPRFFKPDIAVANHAESGESLRSSLGAKRLEKVLSLMRPGDYALIQFGHNDMKERGEGVGAFTTYQASLRQFTSAIRQRGGQVVLVTPMHRRTFGDDGKMRNSHGDYPEAVRRAAKEEGVPLIDLHTMSAQLCEALGPEKSGVLFKSGDGTHHNNFGAYELAKCIVEGIKANQLPLAKFLVDGLPPFDPAKPDAPESFKVPPSPQATGLKPDGN